MAGGEPATRPRLRRDAYLVPTASGARILTNGGAESLTGASIHRWLAALAPRLDGRRSLEELTGSLAADKRSMVEGIVDALTGRGLVRDGPLEPGGPHDGELGYLDGFLPSASDAFARYQAADIVVLSGASAAASVGRLVSELVSVLATSGARRLRTAPWPAWQPDGADLAVHAGAAMEMDRADLAVHAGAAGEADRADLVVHVGADAGAAVELDQACRAAGVPVVHGVLVGHELWVTADGWESLWHRLRPWLGTAGVARGTPSKIARIVDGSRIPATLVDNSGDHERIGPAATALAAATIGMTAFRALTGVAEAARPASLVPRGAATCLDLTSLLTTTHRFLPLTAALKSPLRGGPRLDPQRVDEAGAALVDRRLGVFGEVSERDFAQLPLNVTAVTVPSPAGGPPRLITGAGLDVRDARWRAVLAAVVVHQVSTVDSSRLTSEPAAGRLVFGYRLGDGAEVGVEASAVFEPACRWEPAGVAARYDWEEAVLAALLGACAELSAAEAVRRGGPFASLDVRAIAAGLPPDDEAHAYLGILDVLGVAPTVLDVTGTLAVPTFAFLAGGRTVAYVSALRPDDALADGLRTLVLDEQARCHRQPLYAPPPVPQLDARRGPNAAPAGLATDAADGLDAVVARLAAAGRQAVAVPLDHDAAVHAIVPYAARVVITDA